MRKWKRERKGYIEIKWEILGERERAREKQNICDHKSCWAQLKISHDFSNELERRENKIKILKWIWERKEKKLV